MDTLAANETGVIITGPFPPTTKSAKELGSKYYFTGKACARGHVAPRYAHGSCTQCKADYRANNREKNAAESRQWRLDNPEKCRGYAKAAQARGNSKRYYAANREAEIARALAWNAANPEKAKAGNRRWYDAHKEERAPLRAAYYQENKEAINEYMREYRASRRTELANKSRAWRLDNPEKSATVDRNKKAARKRAPGSHTAADVEAILVLQKHKCAECGVSVKDRASRHVDHIIPLSRGGSNFKANLQILCASCNMEKHATDPIVYAQRKGRLL